MKIFFASCILIGLILISGCNGRGTQKKESQIPVDTISVPDTGYTGIKKYMGNEMLVKEVTFKNGVRSGLMKSFYQDGRVRQTFWYENGVREDSSRWYYQEGQLFRTTPYKNDTIDGVQIQYYRNGKLKAKLGYKKGLRTPFLEEYTQDGKLIGGYPELVVAAKDDYSTKGIYKISLRLSDNSDKVTFYRGDLSGGVFDTAHYKILKVVKGVATLDLKKTGVQNPGYIGVIAGILTDFGNNHLVYKKIDLPYKDIN